MQDKFQKDFRENFLSIVNDCFINRSVPEEAQITRLMMLNKKPKEIPKPS